MTVDEARKVKWLKSNPKPLGDLLDEGFLDKKRLTWTAENAYDPTLKQAAQVLLDSAINGAAMESSNTSFPVGITLEQARATRWPLPPYKDQPMGTLVETRQLSLKDLDTRLKMLGSSKCARLQPH